MCSGPTCQHPTASSRDAHELDILRVNELFSQSRSRHSSPGVSRTMMLLESGKAPSYPLAFLRLRASLGMCQGTLDPVFFHSFPLWLSSVSLTLEDGGRVSKSPFHLGNRHTSVSSLIT